MHRNTCGGIEKKVPRRLKRLMEAHQSTADMESLEVLLPRLLDLARNVTEAEAASFLLYNPKRDVLEFAAIRDESVGDRGGEILKSSVELKMGEGIAGWVAANREPVIVHDVQSDPRFFNEADRMTGFVTRNLLCVPLQYGDELLGVINVLNSKDRDCFDVVDEELLECFADLASTALIRSRFLEARVERQKLQTQLEAAAQIQSLFWPSLPELGAGSNVWAVSVPAAFVGGDVYDFIPMADGSWLVYVADVSDKGLPAALVMVALWSRIRSEALLHSEVDKLLEAVDNAMYDLLAKEGFFATIILGRYWPETGRMQLVRGGHLPPLWIVGDGLAPVPELKGLALGISPGAEYEKKEIVLSPGESILFITDGITEARTEQDELFGEGRMMDHLKTASGPPWGSGLMAEVNAWRGNAEVNDDLTMLEIWRDPT